jgi:large subunit ribosomal protein L14e
VFRNYVEAGRVAFVNFGEDYGKLVVIVDWCNSTKMLVDGENFPRVLYPIRRLTLTKFKLPLLRGARTSTVVGAAKKFGLQQKWEASSQAQKIATHAKRANLSDLERFSVMVNRKRRSFAVRAIAKKALSAGAKGKAAPAKAAAAKAAPKKK